MNPLLAALSDLRVTGAVLLHEVYRADCAIRVPDEAALRAVLRQGDRVRLIPFHFVLQGRVEATVPGLPNIRLNRNDMLILPDAVPHRLAFGQPRTEARFDQLVSGTADLRPEPGAAQAAELVCGVFALRPAPLNPLMDAIPGVLHLETAQEPGGSALVLAAQMLALGLAGQDDGGAIFTRTRLLEILFAEAIRASAPTRHTGNFLAGLADRRILTALAAFHRAPAAEWSVPKLARHAALSPSRFAARFRERLGTSVMDYVADWRLSLACRLLESAEMTLDQIAQDVGYGSSAALSRVFRDRIGVPPGQWRRAQSDGATDQLIGISTGPQGSAGVPVALSRARNSSTCSPDQDVTATPLLATP